MSVVAGYQVRGEGCWLASDSRISLGDQSTEQGHGKWVRVPGGAVGVVGSATDEVAVQRALAEPGSPQERLAKLEDAGGLLLALGGKLTAVTGLPYEPATCCEAVGCGALYVLGRLEAYGAGLSKAEAKRALGQAIRSCYARVPSCGGKVHYLWIPCPKT